LLSLTASHDGDEACVGDRTGFFEVSEPTISHHLKALREAGLVTSERRASWVFYRLVPEDLSGLSGLLDVTGANLRPYRHRRLTQNRRPAAAPSP